MEALSRLAMHVSEENVTSEENSQSVLQLQDNKNQSLSDVDSNRLGMYPTRQLFIIFSLVFCCKILLTLL